jgi:hypothetical protein
MPFTKSVIVNTRFVPQLKSLFFYRKGTKGTKVSQRTVVRQPFVLLCAFAVKK